MAERLSLEKLRLESAYLDLTSKQQKLVEVFLETGDKLKAVRSAFKCKSAESARVMAYALFQNPRVAAVLALAAGGDPELARVKAELLRAAKNKNLRLCQVTALRLYAQLHGFVAGSQPTVEPSAEQDSELQTFPIGAIIVQDGKKYRVVAEEIE